MLILALTAALVIAGADQAIKLWIVQNFELGQEKEFLKIGNIDILHLHFIENNGSAFSSFAGQTTLLLTVTVLGVGVCIYLLIRSAGKNKLLKWSLVMVLGGALGNMADRIFREGRVVDYLDLQLFDFAIFNLADCFVTVGTVLLMIYIAFFMDKDEKGAEKHHDKI